MARKKGSPMLGEKTVNVGVLNRSKSTLWHFPSDLDKCQERVQKLEAELNGFLCQSCREHTAPDDGEPSCLMCAWKFQFDRAKELETELAALKAGGVEVWVAKHFTEPRYVILGTSEPIHHKTSPYSPQNDYWESRGYWDNHPAFEHLKPGEVRPVRIVLMK